MLVSDKKRNEGFDFLRFVCAFWVICIHTTFWGRDAVMLIARAAVPIFFMITGFFYTSVYEKKRHLIQIRKILILLLIANAVYFFWDILLTILSSEDIHAKFHSWISADAFLTFLLTNESPFRAHLWFLGAMLYVLIIAFFLKESRKKLYFLIPVLLGLNLFLGNYSVLFFEKPVELIYTRNFLLLGLPCFLWGDMMYEHLNRKKTKNGILLGILVFSLLLSYWELRLVSQHAINANTDLTLGNLISAYAIFSLVKDNPSVFETNICKRIAWMGKNLSLGLYIFHVIIRTFVVKLIDYLGRFFPILETISYYSMPVIMLIIDSLVVYVMFLCGNIMKKR